MKGNILLMLEKVGKWKINKNNFYLKLNQGEMG